MDAEMDPHEWDVEIRTLSYRGEAAPLIEFLGREPWPPHRLQTVGDALIPALAERIDGAEKLARGCVEELLTRGWDGDVELVEQLRATTDSGVVEGLEPLPVDLDDLVGILEGDPLYGGGSIDLRDGEVWPQVLWDDPELAKEHGLDEEDIGRWLWVRSQGSHEGYLDMELFISQIGNPRRADRLSIAIEGRGAFRRFRSVLERWPEEFSNWLAVSNERSRGRARAWLAAEGYRPVRRA